jgi:ABC-type polysaccharide/polyol phosphate transport system ATPase subunit
MNDAAGLILVSVCGRPAIWFCVDPESDDVESRWMLEHGWIDPPEVALLLAALPPGARALDVGAACGVFALAAAAAGAEVLATDPSAGNVELVRRAARRNGFERLTVVCAASADGLDGAAEADAVRLRGVRVETARSAWERPAVVFDGQLDSGGGPRGRPSLLIDEARRRTLVRVVGDDPPPGAACRHALLDEVPGGWLVQPPLDEDQRLTRLVDEAGHPSAWRRAHAAGLLAAYSHPAAQATVRALEIDVEEEVRACAVGSGARHPLRNGENGDPPPVARQPRAPAARATVAESVVLAASLSLPGELHDAHFHVRAGQYVGVLAARDEESGSALLEAIAGLLAPLEGTLEVLAPPTLVSGLADALQPGLSVAQNLELLSAFVGADVAEVDRRLGELARGGGFADALSLRLLDAGEEVAQRLMVTVALQCASGPLLLLDALPVIDPAAPLRRAIDRRVRELLHGGAAIIQLARDPRELVARADRVMWISEGRIAYNGHAESITRAAQRPLAAASGMNV